MSTDPKTWTDEQMEQFIGVEIMRWRLSDRVAAAGLRAAEKTGS